MNNRSTWSSRLGFVLASAGAAVGLGAIWKFPGNMVAIILGWCYLG